MVHNLLYVQSGGPTAVINASAWGVICEGLHHPERIGRLFAARYGTVGVLNDQLIELTGMDPAKLDSLCHTPSMAFGSCRYRMREPEQDNMDYRRYLDILKKHDIRYLILNGGNGTLASAIKIRKYLDGQGYECSVMVVPKTVDNDIDGIDHSPGFPSAARHVAITVSELSHDIRSYDTGLITIVEVMGRNTGWLAAAALAACESGNGPDLIYVPEVGFSLDKFYADVKEIHDRKGKCMAIVAEGVKDECGHYIFEEGRQIQGRPDLNMGGAALYLAAVLRNKFACKVRAVDLGLMQRCSMHTASAMDVEEAVHLGRQAVREALRGATGKMVATRRTPSGGFEMALIELEAARKDGHPMPVEYVTCDGRFIRSSYLEYLLPLIGSIPTYASLPL